MQRGLSAFMHLLLEAGGPRGVGRESCQPIRICVGGQNLTVGGKQS